MSASFTWWDDAMATANGYAAVTGLRHRVYATGGGLWAVERVR